MEKLIEIAPNWAGIFAFPISLFAVYLHWRTYQRDKGNVTITGVEFREGSYFLVTFVNSGRRPIYLDIAYLRTKTGKKHERFFYTMSRHGGLSFRSPLEMTEGKKESARFDVFVPKSDSAGGIVSSSEIAINPIEVTAAEVVDTTGKRYKRKLTRRQRKEIAHQWSDVGGRAWDRITSAPKK